MKKKTEHYVDNKKFLQAMIEYRKVSVEAEQNNQEIPPVIPLSIDLDPVFLALFWDVFPLETLLYFFCF